MFYSVAEPLYGRGYPPSGYYAITNVDCPAHANGISDCNRDTFITSECNSGPHVAGVRCIQSKQNTSLSSSHVHGIYLSVTVFVEL